MVYDFTPELNPLIAVSIASSISCFVGALTTHSFFYPIKKPATAVHGNGLNKTIGALIKAANLSAHIIFNSILLETP